VRRGELESVAQPWSLARRPTATGALERRLEHHSLEESSVAPTSDATGFASVVEEGIEEELAEAEHGESGEHDKEHGEHHEEADPTSVVVADMLFGFLILDVLLLHLVKWPDPQVRGYMYKMISSTMSIFCAVLINEAFVELFFHAIINLPVAKEPWLVELFVGLLTLCFFVSCLNLFCYRTRRSRNDLYAVQGIFAHLAGFAGILTFESVQLAVQADFKLVCLVVILAGLFLMIMREVTRYVRENAVALHRAGREDLPAEEAARELIWRESIEEGEDDATALILSYLLQQVIAHAITGRRTSLHSVEDEVLAQQEIFGAALIFALLLMVLTIVRADSDDAQTVTRQSSLQLQYEPRRDCKKRVLEWLQTFCSMSMGWCLLRAGVWTIGSLVEASPSMTQVLNAFIMSGVVVVLTILLDKCADTMVYVQDVRRQRRNNTMQGGSYFAPSTSEDGEAGTNQGGGRASCFIQLNLEGGVAHWGTQIEKSLRAIISGFGLAVAICWEHAFEAAGQTMLENTAYVEDHPAIAKGLLAGFVAAVVLPAWVLYIVPMARKSWSDHQASIHMESLMSAGGQKPGDDVKLAALEVAEKAFLSLPSSSERQECQELIDKLKGSVAESSFNKVRTYRLAARSRTGGRI